MGVGEKFFLGCTLTIVTVEVSTLLKSKATFTCSFITGQIYTMNGFMTYKEIIKPVFKLQPLVIQ